VTIDKDIRLDGDGDGPDDVVIEVDDQSPTYSNRFGTGPYGIMIAESDAVVRDLTVRMLASEPRGSLGGIVATAFAARGGSPVIENVVAVHALDIENRGASVYLYADAVANVRDSVLEGWVFVEEQSNATIERNDVGRAIVIDSDEATGTVRGNRAWGVTGGSGELIEGNRFEGPGDAKSDYRGIGIGTGADGTGARGWIIRGNTVIGNQVGIFVGPGSTGTIEGNELADNVTGITVEGSDAILRGNVVRGGDVGIMLGGGSPTLTENTVEGAGRGLSLALGAAPTFVGNTICRNETNLDVAEGGDPPATEGNEICPDGPAVGE
jgi:parallel beta-helix repeat protein